VLFRELRKFNFKQFLKQFLKQQKTYLGPILRYGDGNQNKKHIMLEHENTEASYEVSTELKPKGIINVPGVSFIKTGEKASSLLFEKLKFTKTKANLICLIAPDPMIVKLHYLEDLKAGYVLTSKEIVEDYGPPTIKYVYPCFVYDTNEKGKVVSQDLKLKLLSVGISGYEPLCSIFNMVEDSGKDLTSMDLLVNCMDEQYQKLTFTQSQGRAYEKFEDKTQINELRQFWAENAHESYKTLARSLSPEEYQRLKDGSFSSSNDTSYSSSNSNKNNVLGSKEKDYEKFLNL